LVHGFRFLLKQDYFFSQEFVRALNARPKDEIDDGKSTLSKRFGVLDRFQNKRNKKK